MMSRLKIDLFEIFFRHLKFCMNFLCKFNFELSWVAEISIKNRIFNEIFFFENSSILKFYL